MRFRHKFITLGSLLVVLALLLTDPSQGVSTGLLLLGVVTPLVAVLFAHLGRKALFDYLDLETLANRAKDSSQGAGLVFLGVCIVIFGLLSLFGNAAKAQDVRTYIPPQARPLLPLLAAQTRAHWPDHPMPEALPALVEHESCISLKHSRCWSPTSRLKSAREEGAGLGQITRAWHPDGRLRFDALAEMRAAHPALAGLDWATIYQRPDLQLGALVLKVRGDYQKLRDVAAPLQRLAFADAAYNGGLGGVQRERRACQVTVGCDPGQWWGHVERHCVKSRQPIYGGRSACDINRHHVHDVLVTRAPKYRGSINARTLALGVTG